MTRRSFCCKLIWATVIGVAGLFPPVAKAGLYTVAPATTCSRRSRARASWGLTLSATP